YNCRFLLFDILLPILLLEINYMNNFKKLEVWQKSIQLSIKVYKFCQTLSKNDQFIFSSQLARSAISIPSNIAEGSGKDSLKDYRNYINIAIGSSFEL